MLAYFAPLTEFIQEKSGIIHNLCSKPTSFYFSLLFALWQWQNRGRGSLIVETCDWQLADLNSWISYKSSLTVQARSTLKQSSESFHPNFFTVITVSLYTMCGKSSLVQNRKLDLKMKCGPSLYTVLTVGQWVVGLIAKPWINDAYREREMKVDH